MNMDGVLPSFSNRVGALLLSPPAPDHILILTTTTSTDDGCWHQICAGF